MYQYYNPNSPSSSWAMNAPTVGKARQKARDAKAEAERQKQAEAERQKQAEAERQKQAEAATPYEGPPMRDPVTTLPDATYGESLARKALSPESYPEPEPEPAQPTGPVSLAGGLAVGSGAPNVDMGKLAKSRGGLPYSFEKTEQDPVTVKFPMTQAQFDALSTREQMQADQKLSQTGADRSKMILPTQADVNLYQSREGRLLEDGAPEPTFEIEADPRNYVDPRRPNEGRWIDPQTGDEYNVTEAYGRQLRQRMPQLVRPEVMDRMMGMGMAPKFMEAGKGPDLDKFSAFQQALREKFKPKKGVNREEGLAQLDEEAREQIRQDREKATRGITPEEIEEGLRYVETGEYPEDPEEPLSKQAKKDIAEGKIPLPPARFFEEREQQEFLNKPLPDVSDTEQRELARRSAPTDADAFPPEAYGPNYSGMYSGVEDIPDAMDVSSDFNRLESVREGATPEVDIPIDDDDEADEGFDVQMDPEDIAAFREESENPLGPATAAYEALAEEDPDAIQFAPFEEAVEAALAQPRVTPELSDAELGPFIEAIFGEGTKVTEDIIAQVREILGKEAYRGMTPAQVSQLWNQLRDPLQ